MQVSQYTSLRIVSRFPNTNHYRFQAHTKSTFHMQESFDPADVFTFSFFWKSSKCWNGNATWYLQRQNGYCLSDAGCNGSPRYWNWNWFNWTKPNVTGGDEHTLILATSPVLILLVVLVACKKGWEYFRCTVFQHTRHQLLTLVIPTLSSTYWRYLDIFLGQYIQG